jgi:hypothetical protein
MLFSFNKILILIAILVAVWYGFKLVGRLDRARKRKLKAQANHTRQATTGFNGADGMGPEPIDLVRGEDGKTFVARGKDRRA